MYLAIEGVIGVGKTTLARMLQPSFRASLLLEIFEENPFLSDFYADRERYAFQTQIFSQPLPGSDDLYPMCWLETKPDR
jgi:deoxyguanosine kinase